MSFRRKRTVHKRNILLKSAVFCGREVSFVGKQETKQMLLNMAKLETKENRQTKKGIKEEGESRLVYIGKNVPNEHFYVKYLIYHLKLDIIGIEIIGSRVI